MLYLAQLGVKTHVGCAKYSQNSIYVLCYTLSYFVCVFTEYLDSIRSDETLLMPRVGSPRHIQ